MKTETEIREQITKAREMRGRTEATFEEGVSCALSWVLDETVLGPMDDEAEE